MRWVIILHRRNSKLATFQEPEEGNTASCPQKYVVITAGLPKECCFNVSHDLNSDWQSQVWRGLACSGFRLYHVALVPVLVLIDWQTSDGAPKLHEGCRELINFYCRVGQAIVG